MPGLVGAVQSMPGQEVQPVFEALLSPLQRGGRLQTETHVAAHGQWALGRVHLGILQPSPQLTNPGPVWALFHGELHNEAELRQALVAENVPQPEAGTAALVVALYRAYGRQFAALLKGSFCTVVLDESTKKLVLASDLLGSYFLYWFIGPHRFVFASELKAILRDPAITPTLEPRAVADYLAFGFIFGEKTLAAQVQLLPAASTLTYYWQDGKCTLERYARIDALFQPWEGTQSAYVEHLAHTFNAAVQRACAGEHRIGLSLSGGLDSRAILSAIDCAYTPLSTYTLGVKGCADAVIAEQLARLAQTKHQFFELDARYLGEFLANLHTMVSLTDGMYMTHGLTELLALRYLQEADFSVLLRGHGGELAKMSLAWPFHTDARVHAMHSTAEFVSYMLERVNYISRGIALSELFTDSWYAQVVHGARQSLEASVDKVSLSPGDLCSYLYLTEHHRRFTIPSLELFRNLVEVRLPFVDTDFLTVLWRCPAPWRDGTALHQAITGMNNYALLRVRNSNTGAPGNAGPLRVLIQDKFNSLCKRLHLYGYRHYHNFDAWMRETLMASTEAVLLDTVSLARGMYREATLRRLIEEAKCGAADHGYLLQILLILELWQREHLPH
jgi:asparagine synthase (glutamine-hydrolysing)